MNGASLSDCDLKGLGILVTRPAHQAAGLCDLIEAQGGRAEKFPALEILPPRDPASARTSLLEARGVLIFVSPNAVNFGLRLLQGSSLPEQALLAAVGKGTALALREAGYPVDLIPAERFDSEGLLALPELQQLAGRQVVIVRGDGGRALLGDTLQQRGAELVYAEVYRRHCPRGDPADLLYRWDQIVDLVTVTSNEVLRNLINLLGEVGWRQLKRTPLLVISQRMQIEAENLGFETILRAQNASNAAILKQLCVWAKLYAERA